MNIRIDLNEVYNHQCLIGCSKERRKDRNENDLCTETNSIIDNLPVRCVGEWAVEKIYHLHQYFGIFVNGMKNQWKNGLNYIEICSGPGRCISRNNGYEFDGTALNVIKHKAFPFIKRAIFFDINSQVVDSLNSRIDDLNVKSACAHRGNYNIPETICNILDEEINEGSLNLAFIDPTDCSVPFTLIKKMKLTVPNLDLIVNLASGTDYNRNVGNALTKQDSYKKNISKYSKFLGVGDFFSDPVNIELANRKKYIELRNNFRDKYKNSLTEIGYNYFDFKRIRNYYDLLFASKHSKGLEFWEKANRISFDGQYKLL